MSQCWGFIGERRMVGEGEGGSLEEKLRKPVILHKSKFWRQQDIAGNIEETLNHILRKYWRNTYWRNRFSYIDPCFEGGQDIVNNILKYLKRALQIFSSCCCGVNPLFVFLCPSLQVVVTSQAGLITCRASFRPLLPKCQCWKIHKYKYTNSITGPSLSLQKNE